MPLKCRRFELLAASFSNAHLLGVSSFCPSTLPATLHPSHTHGVPPTHGRTDFALCEEKFVLSRKWRGASGDAWATRDATSFTGDVAVHGATTCNQRVAATGHSDDLSGSVGVYADQVDAAGVANPDPRNENRRALGLAHQYCVAAASTQGKETALTSPACAEQSIFWEATLPGRVVGKGTELPVGGVIVDWEIRDMAKGSLLHGREETDGDGRYEIHIADHQQEVLSLFSEIDGNRGKCVTDAASPHFGKGVCKGQTGWQRYDTVEVIVYVSKGTDPFVCGGLIGLMGALCGGKDETTGVAFPPIADGADFLAANRATLLDGSPSRAVFKYTATYLRFQHDALELVEKRIHHAPIVPFDGKVYFPLQHHVFETGDAATMRPSLAARDSEFAHRTAGVQKCFINTEAHPASSVCLYDYDFGQTPIKCTDTDVNGYYHVAAPMNSRVFVKVRHENHAFKLDKSSVAADGGKVEVGHDSAAPPGTDSTLDVLVVGTDHRQLIHVDLQVISFRCPRVPFTKQPAFRALLLTDLPRHQHD